MLSRRLFALAILIAAIAYAATALAQQGQFQGQGVLQGQGQIVIGPPAIPPVVTISPSVANLATSAVQIFTATVTNDNFGQGVTWVLKGAGCSGSTCGTLSTNTSNTGVPITYTAPSSAPNPNLVTLTATSNLNPTPASSSTVNITITVPPPPIAVRGECIPGSQTTAFTNTFNCPASIGNAVEVTIYNGPTVTVTGVMAGTIPLTQVCSPLACRANSGGVSVQKWYGIGLPSGIATYTVTNTSPSSLMGIGVMDLSNIIALDTASFASFTTATTGPIGPALTTTAADIIIPSLGVTGTTTGIASPFTFIPGVVFGNGLAYSIQSQTGTFNPNWVTTSGTAAGVTSAYIGGIPTPVITVSLAPTTASVKVNTTATFTPTVTNDSKGVNFTLTGAGCSGATCGTLSSSTSASGVAVTYTAPPLVPSPATVTLTAASITNPAKTATATITITSNPIVVSVSPGSASVQTTLTQAFSCTLTNDGANAGCDWTLTGGGCSGATCGTISIGHTASGVNLTYTAPSTVPSPATVTLTAASTTDNTKTAAATITLFAPPPIVVSVNPGSSTVATTSVQAFSCTVTNDLGAAGCDWVLSGAGCSGATCGTISVTHTASGVSLNYTGPGSVPSPATVTLTATSTTDNTKSSSATITVIPAPVLTVTVSPGSASVRNGLTQAFTPTVTNDGSNLGVDWTLSGAGCTGAACGSLSLTHTASGTATVYTAPVAIPSPATVTITATSTTNNTKSASSTITIISLPISVTVAPGTATVPVNGTQAFTPTVTNDPALGGVDWTLSGSCTAFTESFNEGSLPTGWAATSATGVEGGGSFSPSHVSLSQGVLQMSVTQDGTTAGSVGAEVEYNRLFGFGTYSWSMQAAGTSATQGGAGSAVSGQISSTFQYSGGSPSPTEIDAPEIEGQFPNQIEYTTWLNGVRSDFGQTTLTNPQNTYHVYKYIWIPGSITFYLDGVLKFATTTNVPTAPAHPIANLWGTNSGFFGGPATPGITRYMYINNFTYSNCGSLSATHTASGTPVTYTAPASVPSPATVTITATSTTDNTKNAASTITIGNPANLTIAVAPSTASVTTNGTASFTANLTNDPSNQGATWALSGGGCSGATCGTITPGASASGVAVTYTAPVSVPSPATVTVTAKSVTDPTKTATATVTVVAPVITISLAPTTATLQAGGQTQSFTATIANSTQGANLTLSGSTCSGLTCGSLSATTAATGVPFTYTSPSTNVAATVTLTATSIQDGTKVATATIHVNANTTQPSCANTPCPAFLGTGINGNVSAQGGGAGTPGGRGGVVYEVTTLSDSPGPCTATAVGFTNCSLRQAYNAAGPRYVIFRVAGVFPVTAGDLRTSQPFMTIEGHSAPGEVILGGPSTTGAVGGISTHDIIIRYVTMSPDNITQQSGPNFGTTSVWIVNCSNITQALSLATPPPTTSGCYNIMIDHATLRWSGNKSWITTSNFTPTATVAGVGPNHSITTQWTLMYEPSQGHPVGFGTATDEACQSLASNGHCLSSFETDIDFHHNMLVNVDHRIPEIGNKSSRWTNNITYNWSTYAVQELGAMSLDVINNKFIKGPQSGSIQAHPVHWTANGPEICGPPSGYMAGNIFGPVGTNTVDGNQWGDLAIAIAGEDAQAENSVLDASDGGPEWCLQPSGGNQPQTSGVPVPSAWQRTTPLPASNSFGIVADPATSLDTIIPPYVGNWAHLDGNGMWVSSRDPQDTRIVLQYQNGTGGGFYPNDVTYSGVCWQGVTPQCANPTLPLPTPQPNWTDTPSTNFPLQVESLHDGIPDTWKQKYGLSLTNTSLYKTIDTGTGLPYIEDYYDGLVPGTIIASNPLPGTMFSLDLGHSVLDTPANYPTIPFGILRISDAATEWRGIEPSQDTYNFTKLDTWLAKAAADGHPAWLTLGREGAWASSNPTLSCNGGLGLCAPPSDIATGDNFWKNMVTNLVTHAKAQCAAGLGCIKYYEVWNEFDQTGNWVGTMGQMSTLAHDAWPIIHAIDPTAILVAPSVSSCCASPGPFATLQAYAAAGGYATNAQDAISVHAYPSGTEPPTVEYINTALSPSGLIPALMSSAGITGERVHFSEGSWNGSGASSKTADQKTATTAQFYIFMLASDIVDSFEWFQWDNQTFGTLFNTSTNTITAPGIAYQQVENWLIGSTHSPNPCTNNSNTWTCLISRSGSPAEILWNSTSTPTVTLPSSFLHYQTLDNGTANNIVANQVTLGTKPILLTSGSQANLKWTGSNTSGVTSYNVYRALATGFAMDGITCTGQGTFSNIANVPVPGTSYIDTTVSPGNFYAYYTTAVCPTCSPVESLPSNPACVVL